MVDISKHSRIIKFSKAEVNGKGVRASDDERERSEISGVAREGPIYGTASSGHLYAPSLEPVMSHSPIT